MNIYHRSPSYAGAASQAAPSIPFICYRPNFDAEEKLYNIDGQPINIIDNSKANPVLQNIASQVLQPVETSSLDFDGVSEREVLRSMPSRHMETSEVALYANNNLRQLDKDYKDYLSNQKDD